MANVNIKLGYKDSAWFAANATLVLLAGQVVYLQQTGTYKIGDGTTQLQNLAFKGIAQQTDIVVATVVNNTGVNLLASNYQAVKVATAQGQRLAVDFAQANNDNNSADTIGIVRQNINNNQEGEIVILGQITEVNTTGSLQGETWADGDVLYLSPTVAGRITKVKPNGLTGHMVVIGYVEYAHSQHGKIYIKIQNGYELEELHNTADVSYTTPIDADSLLIKDSTASLWKRLTWANLKNFFVSKTATETVAGRKTFNPSVTATSAIAQGTIVSPTLTASANSDVLVGLDITPTFTNGAFTGVSNVAARLSGSIELTEGSYSSKIGSTPQAGALWLGTNTRTDTNYTLGGEGSNTILRAPNGDIIFRIVNTTIASLSSQFIQFNPSARNGTSFIFTIPTASGMTASTERVGYQINGGSKSWNAGNLTLQRNLHLTSQTISFTSASTVTDAYGAFFEAPTAGTNATITNAYSLGTNGKAKFGGNIELTQTVTTETVTSDTTVTIKINGVNYKLLAKS